MTVVASSFERQHNDLYETEAWATEALIKFYPVDGLKVWEPAAGNHKMADVLRQRGADVFTSDIQTYDRTHDAEFDFLGGAVPSWPAGSDAIITNPPYGPGNRLAVKFAERALQHCCGTVALLLTMKFDSGKTRRHLFADNPRFVAKITLLDRIQWFEGDYGGTEDHAWFIWGAKPETAALPRLLYAERSGK